VYARGAIPLAICSLCLLSCAKLAKPEKAVLTLKKDGSLFYGTVVRRDAKSITLTGAASDVHTFLLTDLSAMHFSPAGEKTAAPATPTIAPPTPPTPLPAGGDLFMQPPGTQFAIRSNGFLDSCCVRLNDIELGVLDADITSPKGVVMIPKGASVTFTVSDQSVVGGRLSMTFELTTADYGGHHYAITPGATTTVTGEKNVAAYTGAAESVGKPIHLEGNSALSFRAAAPITFKLST
jgi:hypothetical protein